MINLEQKWSQTEKRVENSQIMHLKYCKEDFTAFVNSLWFGYEDTSSVHHSKWLFAITLYDGIF